MGPWKVILLRKNELMLGEMKKEGLAFPFNVMLNNGFGWVMDTSNERRKEMGISVNI